MFVVVSKSILELSKNFHLTKLSDYRDLENDMKSVFVTCLQLCRLQVWISPLLFCHVYFICFVTVADAEGRTDAMLAFCFIQSFQIPE